MSQAIHISDETYRILQALASRRGQSPEELIQTWAAEQAVSQAPHDPYTQPHYYSTDEWLRHLGVSEEVIERTRAEAEYDADS